MEKWDLYNEYGEKLNIVINRGDILPENTYHGVVDIFIANELNEVLLVRRSFNKEVYPGLWETGAGGSVQSGESFYEAAKRELFEETGIITKPLLLIGKDKSKISLYNEYFIKINKNYKIVLSDESIEYKWVSFDEFLDILESFEFVPSKRKRLQKKLKTIKRLMEK